MRDYYSKYKNEHSWLVEEEGWYRPLQAIREAQLALGNGFLGSRSVLEEIPYDSKPGTYIAGLYDKIGSQVAELVNLPNPFNFKITIEGERLGVITMDTIQHNRTLNLKNGILLRRTVFQDSKKRKYDFQSARFVSMHDKNIGVMQVIFTPLDEGITASIETGIDTSVYNTGTVTEGRKKHFRTKEVGQFKNEGYMIANTFSKLHTIVFRSGFSYKIGKKKIQAKDNIFELKLRKNQTVVFTKVFYIGSTTDAKALDKLKLVSEKKFRIAFRANFDSLLKKHASAWEKLWDKAAVSIEGDNEIEKNFRFNIYHLLICAQEDNGASSIGARTLSGEGYHGHIFWDTEIFLLPFYIYTLPETAKNMLLYRYKRLDAAREIARKNGYKGAMFPWESACLGIDETPEWAKDLDGKIIPIHTGNREHHISADIAYSAYHYYNITADEKFMNEYGAELIFETARFWASRVEYNKRSKTYEIKNVIGPDEFHEDVNNNAFTNMMAKWNMIIGCKIYKKLKQSNPVVIKKITSKIGLTEKELLAWKRMSGQLTIIKKDKKHVIEQFDGYFKKKHYRITSWDENSLPLVTNRLTPRDYGKTQFVKQADVILLLYLLSDVFNLRTKRENYSYYIERTLHKSSLSLPIYALLAIETGDRERAYRFFNNSLHTDISNIHDNTDEGMHAACVGGTWQVVVNGFAGVKLYKDVLSINPHLPALWRRINFSLNYRGSLLKLDIKNDKVKIKIAAPAKKKKIKINVFGVQHEISGTKTFTFQRKTPDRRKQDYYL